jgi:hypothetical protein
MPLSAWRAFLHRGFRLQRGFKGSIQRLAHRLTLRRQNRLCHVFRQAVSTG